LAVPDFSDWCCGSDLGHQSCWNLRLTIAYLGDRNSRSRLRLTIPNLRDWGDADGGASWLAIAGLADGFAGGTARKHIDEDWLALRSPRAVVEVEEVAAEALEPDSGAAERERAVAAGREAAGDQGTGLHWAIKLELEVAGDVSSACLRVSEDTVRQADCERSGSTACALGEITLSDDGAVDGSDLEVP